MWITMLRDDGPYLQGQTTEVRDDAGRELIARRVAVAVGDGPDPHLWGQPQVPCKPTPPLNPPHELIAACARQDIPSAHAAELRAQVALIGERARRVAITAEYERLLALPKPEA